MAGGSVIEVREVIRPHAQSNDGAIPRGGNLV